MTVMGRDIGVGQRVADRDDRARLPRGDDVDATDEVPVVGEAADRHELFRSEISRRRYVVGLPSATIAPVSRGATTSMPQTKYQSSVRRPTGMSSSAAKSPGGDT